MYRIIAALGLIAIATTAMAETPLEPGQSVEDLKTPTYQMPLDIETKEAASSRCASVSGMGVAIYNARWVKGSSRFQLQNVADTMDAPKWLKDIARYQISLEVGRDRPPETRAMLKVQREHMADMYMRRCMKQYAHLFDGELKPCRPDNMRGLNESEFRTCP